MSRRPHRAAIEERPAWPAGGTARSRLAPGIRAQAPVGLALLLALAAGCAAPRHPADWLSVREVTPSFLGALRATDPALAADLYGRVALTFVTRDSTGRNLWISLSSDSGLTFSDPIRVNVRPDSVVSYAEGRPMAAYGSGGALAVAWSERREGSTAVDLVVRASGDAGATFRPPVVVNDDLARPLPAYHGFPALAFQPDGSLFAAWLDERGLPVVEGEPTVSALYRATSADGGQSWSANSMITDRACPCCRPVALSDPFGRVLLAYRRAGQNLRDPALAVSADGGRSFALDTVISADRWFLRGCPDQGPALTRDRPGGGHYAWYTGAGETGVYLVSWRADHGTAGVKRRLSDSLADARSPRLALLGPSTLIGVEARPIADSSRVVFALRALDPDGTLTPWCFLGADVEAGWICGIDAHSALACWIEHDGGRARTRVVKLRRKGSG